MAFYSAPIAGVVGGIMIGPPANPRVNDIELPASSWNWDASVRAIPVISMKSWPYQDVLAGGKQMILTASGICRTNFNPFAVPQIKLGSYQYIRLFVTDNIVAGSPSAFIGAWAYEDHADGSASWSLQATGNWFFRDFGLNNA